MLSGEERLIETLMPVIGLPECGLMPNIENKAPMICKYNIYIQNNLINSGDANVHK